MKSPLPEAVPPTAAKNSRLQWDQLPIKVRAGIEKIMGSPVSQALSQPGGYSPGTADRIVTVSGTRFFVKAVGSSINPDSPKIHRKEIRIMETVSEYLPGSGIIGSYDDGEWVAIIFEDIDGRHPDLSQELDRKLVMDALERLTFKPLSSKTAELLPSLTDDVAYGFDAWNRIAADPIPGLDPWVVQNFDRLSKSSAEAAYRLRGDYMVHTDLRKDNILISGNQAFIVDWPWAAVGAPWFDALTVIIDAGVHNDEFNAQKEIETCSLLLNATGEDIDSVISGMMGYFFDCARQPSPAGISSLRTFQQNEGIACLKIMQQRWGD